MRKTMRIGTFETNSSSAHTLIIALGGHEDIDYGRYWTSGNVYDRFDKMVIDDVEGRLAYLWQAIIDNSDEVDSGEGPGSITKWREIIGSCLPEATLEIEYDSHGIPRGHIDHGGEYADMLAQMYDNQELVAAFLLSPESSVYVSSDEDYEEPRYPDCDYTVFSN